MTDLMVKQGSELDFFDKLHIFVIPPASVVLVFWENFAGKSLNRTMTSNENVNPNMFAFVPD